LGTEVSLKVYTTSASNGTTSAVSRRPRRDIDDRIHCYNEERPHQAQSGSIPGSPRTKGGFTSESSKKISKNFFMETMVEAY